MLFSKKYQYGRFGSPLDHGGFTSHISQGLCPYIPSSYLSMGGGWICSSTGS